MDKLSGLITKILSLNEGDKLTLQMESDGNIGIMFDGKYNTVLLARPNAELAIGELAEALSIK